MNETTESLDEGIVAALCRDGRADVRDIAASVDAVPTTVQKRLRALESEGVIDGYAARIDYDTLGYETVIFRLGVELEAIDEVTARLDERPAFVTVYATSGPQGVFAVGVFDSEAAVADCLRRLHDDPAIRSVGTDRVAAVHLEGGCPIPEADGAGR